MSESSKSLSFLAAGVVSLAAAYFVSAGPSEFDPADKVGQRLNEFEVDEPKSLKIVKVAASGTKLDEFEVAEQAGVWTIPSKQGYPADATEQMASAATGLINREILRVQAKTADEHAALGVLNPSTAELKGNNEGVGTRVVMTDAEDKTLVDLVVGNEVKDSPGQYYVRNANQDVVYVVALEPEKLATDFGQWIEDDLLKLDPFNISQIYINDYSAEMSLAVSANGRLVPQVSWDRRGQMRLAYDNKDAKWRPLELVAFSRQTGEPEPRPLADDEELNEDVLRELRNGLDDLLIVDVERKPTGLSADLKAGDDFLKDRANAESLAERGFAPVRIEEGGPMEILSSEGEAICTMRNGVEYVLRFGKLAMDSDADAEVAADASGGKLNRYLFVSARFNEKVVERPELKDVPPLPEGADEPADSDAAADAEGDETGDEPTEDEEEEEETDDSDSAEEADEEATEDDGDAVGEDAAAEEKPADPEAELEALIAERKSIQAENDRLLDRYQETLKEGRKTVDELNERFGDWYYVISEDVYKQIHLSLDQMIKKKAGDKADAAAGSAPADDDPLSGLPNLPLGGKQ